MAYLTTLIIIDIFYSLRIVLDEKVDREVLEWSMLAFSGEISAKNFALPGTEDKTSGPLNKEGLADSLLLKTLFVNKYLQLFTNKLD